MIELSPKALRFARLVAEQQPALVDDPHISAMRRNEVSHSARSRSNLENSARYISISDDTALFCLNAIDTFLQSDDHNASSDWDGNDIQYLQTIKGHLAHELALDALDGDPAAP